MNSTISQLSAEIGKTLGAHNATVTFAESCTGGGVAHAITSVPGSSAWFGAGFVTYANSAKHKILGVSPEILNSEGAVSEPVVAQMAAGAIAAVGLTSLWLSAVSPVPVVALQKNQWVRSGSAGPDPRAV